MVEMLKGIAASDGVAVAKAYLLVQPDLSFTKTTVEDTSAETVRLDEALSKSSDELQQIRNKAAQSLGEEEAQVFDAHLMVLSDPEMVGQIKQTITDTKVNAESALKEVTDMYIGMFEAMEDNAYMQERAADIRDVAKRVLAHLLNVTLPNPSMINEEVIVVKNLYKSFIGKHILQGIDLSPGENPLPIGHRVRQHPRMRAGGDQDVAGRKCETGCCRPVCACSQWQADQGGAAHAHFWPSCGIG